jgi:DNA polymerase I-like protein with 3'-5' exonuclease and polymerase domains
MNLPDIRNANMICIDVETFDPHLLAQGPGTFRNDGWLVGVALKPDNGPGFYIPIRHEQDSIGFNKAKHYLKDMLGTNIPKLGANILYDLEWLHWLGVSVGGDKHDVQVAEPLLNENKFSYSLETIAQERLSLGKLYDGLFDACLRRGFRVRKKADIYQYLYKLHPDEVAPYAVCDVELPFKIFEQQQKELDEQGLIPVYKLETKLIDVLLKMRINGVPVDTARAEQVREELTKNEKILQDKLKHIAGCDIAIWAASSVAIAFDRAGIAYPVTPKTKQPSFTAAWLEAHPSELAQTIVQLRKTNKLKNDFVENMILKSVINGRIHPSFHPVKHDDGGTVSGRFSSSHPNLQQVPARDPVNGPLIRSLFIPEQGAMWNKHDYCFSDDTEVLTDKGWKLFKDLQVSDLLATYLSDGTIKFDSPINYQVVDYTGDMEHISGKFTDLLVSPQHNCLIGVKDTLKIFKAMDYPKGPYKQYNSGQYSGTLSIGNDFITLLCAIQGDGKWEHGRRIVFHLKKERKIIKLKTVLDNLNINYIINSYDSKPGFTTIIILEKDLPEKTKHYLCGKYKTFNNELWQLKYNERLAFIKELQFWDGSHGYYCSTNKENALFANILFILTNHRSVYKEYFIEGKKPFYHVTCSLNTFTWTQRFKQEKVPYNGKIYCVTMPQSTVIVKRNGRISITGQSQQEPRVTIHYAVLKGLPGAERVAQKYIDDPSTDYHQAVADMCSVERRIAKNINLGLAYGMGVNKMAAQLGRSVAETRELYKRYHAGVPYVKLLADNCMQVATTRGYIKTILGRRRHFDLWAPSLYDPDKPALPYDKAVDAYGLPLRRAFTHKALNSLIQGSSADMIKKAMLDVVDAGYIPHITVHDELNLSIESQTDSDIIKDIMLNAVTLKVPLKVDSFVVKNWGEAK